MCVHVGMPPTCELPKMPQGPELELQASNEHSPNKVVGTDLGSS